MAKGNKGKGKAEKPVKEDVKDELSAMALSGDDVLEQLKEALQVDDFNPEIELAPRVGKVVYKIDSTKVDGLRALIKEVQKDKLEKNPAWKGIPITTEKLCKILGIPYVYDSKKRITDKETNVVTTENVSKEHMSLPTVVEDAVQDAVDDDNGFITLDRIKGGGIKEAGKVMPAYWVKYVIPDGNPDDAELITEEQLALDSATSEDKSDDESGTGQTEELTL